jgi:hypothetical protein
MNDKYLDAQEEFNVTSATTTTTTTGANSTLGMNNDLSTYHDAYETPPSVSGETTLNNGNEDVDEEEEEETDLKRFERSSPLTNVKTLNNTKNCKKEDNGDNESEIIGNLNSQFRQMSTK